MSKAAQVLFTADSFAHLACKSRRYIGIDPGITGAIASVQRGPDGFEQYGVWDLDTELSGSGATVRNRIDAKKLADRIDWLMEGCEEQAFAVIERVSSMPGQGVSTMFSLGDTFGAIRSVLSCLSIPHRFVSPVVWKRQMGLAKREGDVAGSAKARSLALAREMFPGSLLHLAKHHNRAEALLLAEWIGNDREWA